MLLPLPLCLKSLALKINPVFFPSTETNPCTICPVPSPCSALHTPSSHFFLQGSHSMVGVSLNVPSSDSPATTLSAESPCSLHTGDYQIFLFSFSVCLSPLLGCELHEHWNLLVPSCISSADSRAPSMSCMHCSLLSKDFIVLPLPGHLALCQGTFPAFSFWIDIWGVRNNSSPILQVGTWRRRGMQSSQGSEGRPRCSLDLNPVRFAGEA